TIFASAASAPPASAGTGSTRSLGSLSCTRTSGPGIPEPWAAMAAVVPQRAVLVLPTTGEFDSRAYRIGRALAERGHEVTMIARAGPGLPVEEHHPAGYRILRVAVGA